MTDDFKIQPVPIPTLLAFLEATAAHPNHQIGEIAAYAGFSERTATRALPVLESVGLVSRDGTGKYACRAQEVRRGMGEEAGRLVFRRALQSYRPFEAMCEGLALGEPSAVAVRKARSLLGLPASDDSKFDILLKWAGELGIVHGENGRVTLAPELLVPQAEQFVVISQTDVESETKARLYNAGRLGRNAYDFLDEVDRRLLAEALLLYSSKPHDAAEKAGQAVENFLREIAKNRGLDTEASKLSGAGQIASFLINKTVIHSHHAKLVEAVSTVRNATAHSKDRKTMTPWDITEFGAFWACAGALTAIRSIYEYCNGGSQTI